MKRAVVTGIGTINPIAHNVEDYVRSLKDGISGAAKITLVNPEDFKTQFACEVKDFIPDELLDRKASRRMDRFCQFAMVAADEAYQLAGLGEAQLNPDRCGVIWGSGIGGMNTYEEEFGTYMRNGEGTPRFSPFMIPKLIIDIAAGYISMKYDFRGVNFATVSACASSSHAILSAVDQILLDRADLVLAGGSEAGINIMGIGGFSNMKALSTRNDDPATASRPFDRGRDGFVLGEGSGALVIESYEHAKNRGATILAEVGGGASTADAYHLTAPHPEGRGAAKVMELALKDARMNPEDIDYINVHGTSTPLGDKAEILAIQKIFGQAAYDLNISSTKSMTGHLLGGAGAIEAIAGIIALTENFIPPTINHFEDDPEIDAKLNLTFNEAQEKEIRTFITNTFGFGGHNTSIIMKKV
jgi:3-oxoacyl-[acyl-carrier-protein] synthase II